MRHHRIAIVIALLIGATTRAIAAPDCEALKALKLPDTTITTATAMAAGSMEMPAFGPLPVSTISFLAHCRVAGTIRPTADSVIGFEVWLPVTGWNRRYQQVGNGGLAGSIRYDQLATALKRGYATASTDDGHVTASAFDATWVPGHPEKLIDYGYRAVHLTALAAQKITRAYYGQAADHDYVVGCSDGGRESLMEAQRYPADFDGYLVGAPGIDIPGISISDANNIQAQQALSVEQQPTLAQLQALSRRVLERCDARDGVKDGVLRDPLSCNFKASEMICKGTPDGSCLTSAQAAMMQRIYDGPKDSITGAPLAPGNAGTLGTEDRTWPRLLLDAPSRGANALSGNVASMVIGAALYGKPDLNLATLDLAQATRDTRQRLNPIINSDNPDLRAARQLGKKIIQFHGWADPNIPPQYSLAYFAAVQKSLKRDTSDFYRLFMAPGMRHCNGGVGPAFVGGIGDEPLPADPEHDWISALEQWVERGVAPERIIATEFKLDRPITPMAPIAAGTPVKSTRPLCPYPKVAKYQGRGSTDDASNFACAMP
jgi:feruloyl esterase